MFKNNKFYKRFVTVACALLLLVGSVSTSQAISQAFTIGKVGNDITNFVNQPIRVNTVTLLSGAGGATNLTFAIIDAPLTNSPHLAIQGDSWSGRAWTNTIRAVGGYATNITKIVTNFTGITYTNTVSGYYSYTNTAGGFTNLWDIKYGPKVLGSNGSSLTIDFSGSVFSFGFSVTNINVGVDTSVIVDYDPVL